MNACFKDYGFVTDVVSRFVKAKDSGCDTLEAMEVWWHKNVRGTSIFFQVVC